MGRKQTLLVSDKTQGTMSACLFVLPGARSCPLYGKDAGALSWWAPGRERSPAQIRSGKAAPAVLQSPGIRTGFGRLCAVHLRRGGWKGLALWIRNPQGMRKPKGAGAPRRPADVSCDRARGVPERPAHRCILSYFFSIIS